MHKLAYVNFPRMNFVCGFAVMMYALAFCLLFGSLFEYVGISFLPKLLIGRNLFSSMKFLRRLEPSAPTFNHFVNKQNWVLIALALERAHPFAVEKPIYVCELRNQIA